MSRAFSEDSIVEQPVMEILSQDLAWEVSNVYEGETFGASGTIGRDSQADVLLKHRFIKAIELLNPDLPEVAYTNAYELINANFLQDESVNLNQHYRYFLPRRNYGWT